MATAGIALFYTVLLITFIEKKKKKVEMHVRVSLQRVAALLN